MFTLRAQTRENPFSPMELAQRRITPEGTRQRLACGALLSMVCLRGARLVGFCSGAPRSGEILVIAVLPQFEGRGIGRTLLERMAAALAAAGCTRVWLAAAPDPQGRAHGFYRHLGWRPTGARDAGGDEVLVLRNAPRAQAQTATLVGPAA